MTLLPDSSPSPLRPIILYHGMGSGAEEMRTIAHLVQQLYPGTHTTSLPIFEGLDSIRPLQEQIRMVIDAIRSRVTASPELYSDGYNLVCKSQGAAVCRMVISEMDDHNVHTFIGLAGPQMGCFGFDYLRNAYDANVLPAEVAGPVATAITGGVADAFSASAWMLAYHTPLRGTSSIFQLWRDWRHLDDFYEMSPMLPPHTENATARMRTNFMRLHRAVFAVGSGRPFEGGIAPWQTAIFGAHDSHGTIRSLFEQEWYTGDDTLGLRALHEAGNLTLTVVPNASHAAWTSDPVLIRDEVIRWLV